MAPLAPPDSHYLLAATGWLQLGNPAEAALELDHVAAEHQEHPDMLEVRWEISAARKNWEQGLVYAELLLRNFPNRASGWLHRAYALRRVKSGGLQSAWTALRPAYEKFPNVSLIPYNLACYAAQSSRLDEAWEWFHKALDASDDRARIKEMALADPDLEPIWDRVRALS